MMNEDEIPSIDPEDLRTLRKELRPPSDLEDRVVNALASRGLIHKAKLPSRPWVWAVAAVLLVAISFGAGRVTTRPPVASEPNFVFLLHEGSGWQTPISNADEQHRVDEYRAWVHDLRRRGLAVDGIKLDNQVRAVAQDRENAVLQDSQVAGLFTLRARDLQDAIAIARTCPHLRYGGQIEVRKIQGV